MDQILALLVGLGWLYIVAGIIGIIAFVVIAVIVIKQFINFDKDW